MSDNDTLSDDTRALLLTFLGLPASSVPPYLLRAIVVQARAAEPLPPLARRWLELLRDAYEAAARPACGREQDRLWEAMDDEDPVMPLLLWRGARTAQRRAAQPAPSVPERRATTVFTMLRSRRS